MKGTGPNLLENFILDYFSVDWEDLLKTDELSADNSTRMYLDKINILLGTYAALKRINKYKLKFKSKPWINLILLYSPFRKHETLVSLHILLMSNWGRLRN